MNARTVLIVLCLIGARQLHATNQVAILTNSPPGLVRLSTNLTEFAEAALSAGEAKQARGVNLIAWAAKSSDLAFPPQVSEEAIVLVNWTDSGGTNRWCLARVLCASTTSEKRSWIRGSGFPGVPSEKEWNLKPSDEEIAAFIKSTNFGYNECDPDVRVLRVVAYREAASIVQALKEGVSDSEKSERRAKLRSVFWHPRK